MCRAASPSSPSRAHVAVPRARHASRSWWRLSSGEEVRCGSRQSSADGFLRTASGCVLGLLAAKEQEAPRTE